jgi:hypothetical protein
VEPAPVPVWVLSSTLLLASPRNTLARAARAVTDVWLIVMVLPFASAFTL